MPSPYRRCMKARPEVVCPPPCPQMPVKWPDQGATKKAPVNAPPPWPKSDDKSTQSSGYQPSSCLCGAATKPCPAVDYSFMLPAGNIRVVWTPASEKEASSAAAVSNALEQAQKAVAAAREAPATSCCRPGMAATCPGQHVTAAREAPCCRPATASGPLAACKQATPPGRPSTAAPAVKPAPPERCVRAYVDLPPSCYKSGGGEFRMRRTDSGPFQVEWPVSKVTNTA